MIENLKEKNSEIEIFHITDKAFNQFGKILDYKQFGEAYEYLLNNTSVPETSNKYIAHDEAFENSLSDLTVYKNIFGDIKIEFGYCNGNNSLMNALEYHKSPEINIAVTPLVLLLGKFEDIVENTYDSSNLLAFFIPEHTAIELNPKVLHFSPCKINNLGFKCGVILPYSTNMERRTAEVITNDEDMYLFMINKWLIAHKDFKRFIDLGAYQGIKGKNIEIKY